MARRQKDVNYKNHPNPIVRTYAEDPLLFYLRTHPHWYKILSRYPNRYKEFTQVAKEELKITTYHKIEQFRNQMSLLSLLGEYMKRSE